MKRRVTGFVIGALIVGPMTYWISDREPPHYRVNGEMIPSQVHPGDQAEVHWEIHTNRMCEEWPPGRGVQRFIIDGAGKIDEMEPTTAIAGRMGDSKDSIIRKFRIPMGVTDGPARYRSSACFKCNWTQRWWPVCVSSPDVSFTILKRDQSN